MESLKLRKQLQSLNKEQKKAVESINGPVMVIAGPGTGKTQILTLRIANILLKTDASPENILALTFTESAAANIRRRLVGLIGTQGYYANISTFHGFCNEIIQDYPEKFSHIIGSVPATPINKIYILRKIINSSGFKKIKPMGNLYYYIPALSKAMRDLKNEGIDYSDFKKAIETQKKNIMSAKLTPRQRAENLSRVEKNIELALVYDLYQKELRRQKLYDFEDMILETTKAFQKDKDFLLDLQEKYQYILVDEHQDTNGAQNKALELLAGYDNNPNLFVVGDEKQAIFRFQGASLENFLYFKNKFPKVQLVNLEQNYRSTQSILDASHSLIEKNTAALAVNPVRTKASHSTENNITIKSTISANDTRLWRSNGVKLKSQEKKSGSKIKICELPSAETECEFIADNIKRLLAKKIPAGEIAILFRENKDSRQISKALARSGIPFDVESDENILEDSEIKKLNILFEAIENFANPAEMAKALHLDFFNIAPMDIYKSLNSRVVPAPSVEKIYKKIGDWKKLNYNVNFAEFFETVAKESGFIAGLLKKSDYPEKIAKLNSLFAHAKKSALADHKYNLSKYLADLKILAEHNIPIKTKSRAPKNSVRLMTAHKAKGLEFDYVFICGARDKHWGNKRDINLFKLPIASLSRLDSAAEASLAQGRAEKNEDERRLFYMAITRARKEVIITYPAMADDGREYVPSQFINEIRPDLREEITLSNTAVQSLALDNQKPSLGQSVDEKSFIRDLFIQRGLSPTSLNNYLRCPWQFFYSNLLRLPQTPTLSQIYGTAKHLSLQHFFNVRTSNVRVDIRCPSNLLVEKFISELKRSPLSKTDFKFLAEKGKKSLRGYYDFYKNSWPANTINEYKINGVDFAVGKEKIKLTGKLDKIEFDPKNRRAVVTDYKTKKPASRNWILGETKDSNGDYFKQLVFYKLLLDSMIHKKFNMETGVIDFTEPDDKNRFKKEAFEITDSNIKNLREVIAQTADEIINLKFWNKTCGQKDCSFCALRGLLK